MNRVENKVHDGRKARGSWASGDFCGLGLRPEDSIALADIMGRFMETERLIQLESRE